MDLAIAYEQRIWGVVAENIEQAIHHYEQALEVYHPRAFPRLCRNVASALGALFYARDNQGDLDRARAAFETAHRAVEALRGEASREGAKRALSLENAALYARLVACCLRTDDVSGAFTYATAGKGRAFVDLLASARFDLNAGAVADPALSGDLVKVRALQRQADALRMRLTGEDTRLTPTLTTLRGEREPRDDVGVTDGGQRAVGDREALYEELLRLQAEEDALWEDLVYKYPALTATQQAPALSPDEAVRLAADTGATLVEYYQHYEGWCAFIVTPQEVHHISLPRLDDALLGRMGGWLARVGDPQAHNALGTRALETWHEAVLTPVRPQLRADWPTVLAPFGLLHLLPLGAARDPVSGRYAAEEYVLALAPSLSALRVAWEQARRQEVLETAETPGVWETLQTPEAFLHPDLAAGLDLASAEAFVNELRLLDVAYPGAPDSPYYLPHVLAEATAVARCFPRATVLVGPDATPEALLARAPGQNVLHLGCHALFDPDRPEQSGLMLAGGWLTVRRVVAELRLAHTRLVTLGACETGRATVGGGDEQVGLTQAIMTAGARVVVSSLWPVDDAATRALLVSFYQRLA